MAYMWIMKIEMCVYQSKKEVKDQELIQLGTTPDPGHHMGKWQKHNKTSYTRVPKGGPRGQPFPSRWPQGYNEQTRKHGKHKNINWKEATP